ncbi:unnamed protein product [Caenorhabditis brenneri]
MIPANADKVTGSNNDTTVDNSHNSFRDTISRQISPAKTEEIEAARIRMEAYLAEKSCLTKTNTGAGNATSKCDHKAEFIKITSCSMKCLTEFVKKPAETDTHNDPELNCLSDAASEKSTDKSNASSSTVGRTDPEAVVIEDLFLTNTNLVEIKELTPANDDVTTLAEKDFQNELDMKSVTVPLSQLHHHCSVTS